jgi:hypothetical protein
MESSAKTRLPLHSIGIIYPSLPLRTALHFGIIFTLITHTIEAKVNRALKCLRFLWLMPKGERVLSPKQKDHTTTNFKVFKEVFNWHLMMKIFNRHISNWYLKYLIFFQLIKPSWTLRGEFHSGGVLCKSKKKHLKQGEKISNLENASCNLIHTPLTICKRTLKRFSKRICKNKTSGANVVQNVKSKKAIHAYLMKI